MDNVIVHFCSRADWLAAVELGVYRHESLDIEGFVHCSEFGTVHLAATRMYPGRTDLVLLVIDPSALDAHVRWEPAAAGDPGSVWFPHVYGPVSTIAVVDVHDFPPEPDGTFRLPPALAG